MKTIPACFRILSLHSIIFLPWELRTGVKKIIMCQLMNGDQSLNCMMS